MRLFEVTAQLLSFALLVSCGKPDERVLGGNQATPNEHKSIVVVSADRTTLCTGIIINAETVLTAASCVEGTSYIFVAAGEHDLQNANHNYEQASNSTTATVHPEWVSSGRKQPNLALVKLNQPFVFNDWVQPAVLARQEPPVGAIVTAAGWGKRLDQINNIPSMILFEAHMPVTTDDAGRAYYTDPAYNFDRLVCTDTTGGASSCGEADLGGPLYNSGRLLVGVTALYPNDGAGNTFCSQGHPSCYTSILAYRDWICDPANVGAAGCTDESQTTTTTRSTTTTSTTTTGTGTTTTTTSPTTTTPNGSERTSASLVALVFAAVLAKMFV